MTPSRAHFRWSLLGRNSAAQSMDENPTYVPIRARRSVHKNIGKMERAASLLGGATLVALTPRLTGAARLRAVILAGELSRRGLSGSSLFYRVFGLDRSRSRAERNTSERSVTIARPRAELFREWMNPRTLPKFQKNLLEVRAIDDHHFHWILRGRPGDLMSLTIEILERKENEWIHWRTTDSSALHMEGLDTFTDAPGAQGTELRVYFEYRTPGGPLGKDLTTLFGGNPDQVAHASLRRFKQLMETGEIATPARKKPQRSQIA